MKRLTLFILPLILLEFTAQSQSLKIDSLQKIADSIVTQGKKEKVILEDYQEIICGLVDRYKTTKDFRYLKQLKGVEVIAFRHITTLNDLTRKLNKISGEILKEKQKVLL